jgi:class 3 adenylate cyclase
MPRPQAKDFATADVRDLSKARFEIIEIGDATIGHSTFEPGWRWSVDLAPVVGTTTCQIRHLGYSVSGRLRVRTDDGETIDIGPNAAYEIPPGHDAWVLGEEPWVTIEWTSGRAFGAVFEGPDERVIATVLFTDVVDSTATLERLGDVAWRDRLDEHTGRLRDSINVFRGREIKTTGDGVLAVFDSATRAVRCAAEMVRSARSIGIAIRVGIHTGEIELINADARGIAVHTAARVLALAGPDEVLVSSTTRDLLEGSGIDLEDAGRHELKGLSGARQVYRLVDASRG